MQGYLAGRRWALLMSLIFLAAALFLLWRTAQREPGVAAPGGASVWVCAGGAA